MELWIPSRRAFLNAHIAKLRGWTNVAQTSMHTVFGTPPNSHPGLMCQTPKWADGVAETWDLQQEERIETGFTLAFDSSVRMPRAWRRDSPIPDCDYEAPTIPIAVCLAYAACKGAPFHG